MSSTNTILAAAAVVLLAALLQSTSQQLLGHTSLTQGDDDGAIHIHSNNILHVGAFSIGGSSMIVRPSCLRRTTKNKQHEGLFDLYKHKYTHAHAHAHAHIHDHDRTRTGRIHASAMLEQEEENKDDNLNCDDYSLSYNLCNDAYAFNTDDMNTSKQQTTSTCTRTTTKPDTSTTCSTSVVPLDRRTFASSVGGAGLGISITSLLILDRPVAHAADSNSINNNNKKSPPPRDTMLVGGGFDIRADTNTGVPQGLEVIFPSWMRINKEEGECYWDCQHRVISMEGDVGQAKIALKALGFKGVSDANANDSKSLPPPESYRTKFIVPGVSSVSTTKIKNDYVDEETGNTQQGLIMDRGFDMESRLQQQKQSSSSTNTKSDNNNNYRNVIWDATTAPNANTLSYDNNVESEGVRTTTTLTVVDRIRDLPTSSHTKGWGSNELYRISTSTSTAAAAKDDGNGNKPLVLQTDALAATMQQNQWSNLFTLGGALNQPDRAVRVQHRYRPQQLGGSGADGNGVANTNVSNHNVNVVEGIEIIKTYRVLDGIAGTEYPTSTTRSQFLLTRR
jgi:hypothetical protein